MHSEFPSAEHKFITSIRGREFIEAPSHYVSIYHETRKRLVDGIDKDGLLRQTEAGNFSGFGQIIALNRLLHEVRPEAIQQIGLDRENVLFGYIDLQKGHGMTGFASERFYDAKHQSLFATWQQFGAQNPSDYFTQHGVQSWQDMRDLIVREYQANEATAGAILELKVDPATCYVGDLHIIEEQRYPRLTEERVKAGLKRYWENILTLKDVLRWYKKPEEDENGRDEALDDPTEFGDLAKIKGAPSHWPASIYTPEVLIPYNVPQKFIRLVAE